MVNTQADFLELAIKVKALLFGNFTLKSGKESLYFFNISAFLESGYISNLADLFSQKIIQSEIEFEVIFGPAYKGIPLAAAVATKLSQQLSKPISVCFNRKEKKDHGEGGVLVGSVKDKKVLILSPDFGAPALDDFIDQLPDQFIHTGISEQNTIDTAAGLTLSGYKVFIYAKNKNHRICMNDFKTMIIVYFMKKWSDRN